MVHDSLSQIEIPPEPKELKKTLKTLLKSENEKYVLFTGNKLPKYIWDNLYVIIKEKGGSWQSLLKALSLNYALAIKWLKNELSWEEFITKIIETATSPITSEKRIRKTTILDFLEQK